MKGALLFGLLSLLLCLVAVGGQTCQEWDGEPAFCKPLLEYEEGELIYLPDGHTLANSVQMANLVLTGVGLLDVQPDEKCSQVLYSVMCAQLFRPCVQHNGESVPLPRNICYDFCRDYVTLCANFTAQTTFPLGAFFVLPPGVSTPINCSELDVTAQNTHLFPENSTFLMMPDGEVKEVECYEGIYLVGGAKDCNPPLEREGPNAPCMFKCPLPAYTDEQWDSIKIMQLTIGFFSLIGTFLLILTYSLSPKHRRYPANLVLMIAISSHIAAIAIILPVFDNHETIWCGPDTQLISPEAVVEANFTGSLIDDTIAGTGFIFSMNELVFKAHTCNLQGTILQFAFLATTTWWCILTFNMLLCLFATKIYQTKRNLLQIVYHSIGWGLPFIFAIIPVAASKIALQPGGTFCFVSPEDDNIWMIFLWYLPIGVLMLIAVVAYLASVIKIIIMFTKFRGGERTTLIVTYVRLLLFIFTFLIVYTFIFAYGVRVGTDQSDIEDEWGKYLSCFVYLYGRTTCELDETASNYPLTMLRGFGYSSLGFLLFLNFSVSKELFLFWWNLFRTAQEEGVKGLLVYLQIGAESKRAAKRQKTSHAMSGGTSRRTMTTLSTDSQSVAAE
ncbi:hypothetical protein QOT17_005909 [Balamuthia mandrillaris]